jgi:ATP-dependent Lon protease
MEALIKYIRYVRILGVITSSLAILAVAVMIWYRRRKAKKEGFQAAAAAAPSTTVKEIAKEIPIPDDVANPTAVPMVDESLCSTIKKTIDSLRLTEMNKKMKEFVESEQFKTMKSTMEERFRTLNCKEYLEKVAAGVIPAPQTSPDMRPAPEVLAAPLSSS